MGVQAESQAYFKLNRVTLWLGRILVVIAFFLSARQFHYELRFLGLRGYPFQGAYRLRDGMIGLLLLLLLQGIMTYLFTKNDGEERGRYVLHHGCVLLIALLVRTLCTLYDMDFGIEPTFAVIPELLSDELPLIFLVHGSAQALLLLLDRGRRLSAQKAR